MPKAYLCAEFAVLDAPGFGKHREMVVAVPAPFGDRHVVRRAGLVVLNGNGPRNSC